MSIMSDSSMVPQWTLGWRIRRAIEHGGLSTEQLAEHLDVSRSTVSRWSNDHGAPPKRLYLAAIADMCHVDPDWLRYGTEPTTSPDGPSEQASDQSSWTVRDDENLAEVVTFPSARPTTHGTRAA